MRKKGGEEGIAWRGSKQETHFQALHSIEVAFLGCRGAVTFNRGDKKEKCRKILIGGEKQGLRRWKRNIAIVSVESGRSSKKGAEERGAFERIAERKLWFWTIGTSTREDGLRQRDQRGKAGLTRGPRKEETTEAWTKAEQRIFYRVAKARPDARVQTRERTSAANVTEV